ncbi:hypothetical protein EV122DRAFT_268998 [Schizophyllum commune]|nr:hypothetical protein K523DRAFT_243126 [Schizophyllum commune Tattone D]
MPTSGFTLTDGEVLQMNHMSAGAAMGSFFLCSMILVVSGLVYRCPPARPALNRISFRLLLWTMVMELLYDISYTVCVLLKEDDNRGACTASVFGIFMFVGITNYLVTCVALNLCLVLVFGVNVLKLEKWYIMGSFAVGIFVPIVPAALGKFGWDPLLSVCWVTVEDPNSRIVMFVMALYLWQLLSCLLATVFVGITLVTLYMQGRKRERSLNSGTRVGQVTLKEQVSSGGESSENGTKTGSKTKATATTTKTKQQKSASTRTFRDQFISVAIRVSAYPIALIVVNAFIAFADLTISVHGDVDSRGLYAIYVIYYFLYGARGGIFAAIALFVDPSLTRGVSIMYKYWRNGGHVDTSMPVSSGQRSDTQFAGATSTLHGGVLVTVELQEFGNSTEHLPKVSGAGEADYDREEEEEEVMDDKPDVEAIDGTRFSWKSPKEDVEAPAMTEGRPATRFAKKENKRAIARQRKLEAQAAFEQATAQL